MFTLLPARPAYSSRRSVYVILTFILSIRAFSAGAQEVPVKPATPLTAGQSSSDIPWKSRGLNNVGGRTLALAIDLNDENVLLAGASGGLWRSEDQGKSWKRVTKAADISGVTFIVQDPRPAFRNIWYYSTGERVEPADVSSPPLLAGKGIFKSSDGGRTFTPLLSTAGSPFSYISSLAINPKTGDLLGATATGIFRSSNGGLSFTLLLNASADRQLHYTEVMFTPAGILYATLSSASTPSRGIYRSLDGGNSFKNIDPPGFPTAWGRIVMNFAPADPRIVYFLGYNKGNDQSFLFKVKYSGDPAKADPWYDFTRYLTLGRASNQVNVQRGYAMMISFMPADTNSVLLGGVNLDFSGSGFSSFNSNFRFGGTNASLPGLYYPGHHPNQHQLLFFASNPLKAVSATDGGIFLTDNLIQDAGPGWISLNNGYNAAEVTAVSLDPLGKDSTLLASVHNNGAWSSGAAAATAPWTRTAFGNTDLTALQDGGKTRYVSTDYGDLYQLTYASGTTDGQQPSSVTYLSPAKTGPGSGFQQRSIFSFDENNRQILYYPQGNFIWRNLQLDKIPAGNTTPAPAYWKKLSGTQLSGSGSHITALVTSRLAPSNRLYYASNTGEVYRLDNANIGDRAATNISSGKGLPAGTVSCLAVDPANGDHVMLAFSDYGIKSIFYSPDAGKSWGSVSGNLEQFPDGSGNGPSVRWISIAGNNDRYLAGTSTGLYAASSLQGDQTSWIQQSTGLIGNQLISSLKVRDDGYTVIASHGNGVFEGIVPVTKIPAASLTLQRSLDNRSGIAGGPVTAIDLNALFKTTDGKSFSAALYNSDAGLVHFSLSGHYAMIEYIQGKTGTLTLGLIATKGAESVSTGFDLSVKALSADSLLYSQFNHLSYNFTTSGNSNTASTTRISADDFFVPPGQTWNLDRLRALGSEISLNPSYHSINVVFYTDSMGKPGRAIRTEIALTPLEDTSSTNLYVKLRTTLTLGTGHYWLSLIPDENFTDPGNLCDNQWGWATQAHSSGQSFQSRTIRSPLSEPTSWINSVSPLFNPSVPNADFDLSFLLYGSKVLTPASAALSAVKVFTNPNTGFFKVSVPVQTGDVFMNIYTLQGLKALPLGSVKAGTTAELNMTSLNNGTYILKMGTPGASMSVYIVKQ